MEKLPAEIIIMVLGHAPDLASLYNLTCTCARISSVFDIDSARIVDKVIINALPRETWGLARLLAIFGATASHTGPYIGPSQPTTFDEFVTNYQHPKVPALYPSLRGTPGPRYVLLWAHRIRQLQHICLVTLLHNIHQMRPSYPNDPDFKSKVGPTEFPIGVPFAPSAWWSPSWVERYRVERALWHLVVQWGLQAMGGHGSEIDDQMRSLFILNIRRICPKPPPLNTNRRRLRDYIGDEMNCISKAVRRFLGCSPFEFFHTYSTEARVAQLEKALSKISTLLGETEPWRSDDPRPDERSLFLNKNWGLAACYINVSSLGLCYGFPPSDLLGHSNSPTGILFTADDFKLFDRLGIFIWSGKRIAYLGLQHQLPKWEDNRFKLPYTYIWGGEYDAREFTMYIWRSLLLLELDYLDSDVSERGQIAISDGCKKLLRLWREHLAATRNLESGDVSALDAVSLG
jgi:hypothetical protein